MPEDTEQQPEPTRRHEECDLSPEDEEIFDEVTRKIIEAGGLDNMPDGF